MFGFGAPSPVAEYEATGEIEQIYHDIRQTLRVNGVNLLFRTWAAYDQVLPIVWNAVKPNVETRAFEDASDTVRAAAMIAARQLDALNAREQAGLGESQAYQVRAALSLYHYINPKLLLLICAVKLAVDGDRNGRNDPQLSPERIDRGVPGKMYPMEMVPEHPEDKRLKRLFADIKRTLSLKSINSDYRTLGLWPHYLETAWMRLKPVVRRRDYWAEVDRLRERARALAESLPFHVPITARHIAQTGAGRRRILQTTSMFERILPPLILNMALMESEWRQPDDLLSSPVPAAKRQDG
jgi:hypothetical protein